MSDAAFGPRTLKRKNVKGLSLGGKGGPPPRAQPPPAQKDDDLANQFSTLEIGVEFKLDLKAEDLIVMRELGAGNGGTVSKVRHAATNRIMAKKVLWLSGFIWGLSIDLPSIGHPRGCKAICAKANPQRTPHHAWVPVSIHCVILWGVFKWRRCCDVHGVYGLRVSIPHYLTHI